MQDEADPPNKDAFPSWRSYRAFNTEVARTSRYVRSPEAVGFLRQLAAQSHGRVSTLEKGRPLVRAQVAHADRYEPQIDEYLPDAALPERMRPRAGRATEGRVNPKGIPCLYLAGDKHTAIAEVRPWIGSLVTLGYFEITRDVRVVDCTRDMEADPFYFEEPGPEERNAAVWRSVGQAFREPIARDDDIAAYAATQVIAETFRAEGFDGVAYRSAFGTDRFSVALFDLDAAKMVCAELHEIRDVTLDHVQSGDPYYVQVDENGETTLVRNVITAVRPLPKEPEAAA